MVRYEVLSLFFFFNDTPTTEISTLSLHDALPIYSYPSTVRLGGRQLILPEIAQWSPTRLFELAGEKLREAAPLRVAGDPRIDRKSTRLNSSHANISYAVFCLKKKNNNIDLTYSHA